MSILEYIFDIIGISFRYPIDNISALVFTSDCGIYVSPNVFDTFYTLQRIIVNEI